MKHYQKDQRVQSLMIEINRWLYLGEDYSVDSERTKTLVSVLRLFGECYRIINFQCGGSALDRNTHYLGGLVGGRKSYSAESRVPP